ncbi:MAG: DNA translocase FtsK [Chlamydiae bacterium]|nr:DNA translocase FtsK [Chlamydiota bacterium]
MNKKKESTPEIKGLLFIIFSFLILLSLCSFDITTPQKNWLGLVGFCIGSGLYFITGLSSFFIPIFLGWIGFRFVAYREFQNVKLKTFYFFLFLISICILLNIFAETFSFIPDVLMKKIYVEKIEFLFPYPHLLVRYNLGGVPLYYLYKDFPHFNLEHIFSNVGMTLIFSFVSIISFLLLTEVKLLSLWFKIEQISLRIFTYFKEKKPLSSHIEMKNPEEIERKLSNSFPNPIYSPPSKIKIPEIRQMKTPSITTTLSSNSQMRNRGGFYLPKLDLLKNPKKIDHPTLKKDLKRQAEILEETLLSFGIEAKVGDIFPGPTITSFEVHPAVGVKVQKIKTLENDIALNLQAKSIRIIAPIPGKAAVGVEIPSIYPQEVSFKELLISYQQQSQKFLIPLLLGKSVHGDNVMADLSKMPHCLIAGATGSGKSVCINTLIMSILMNATPDEIKLLMIDPKKVELTAYSQLPHMIAPVITEAHGAYAALNWLVKEMQLRYETLKLLGVRNITAFNERKINHEMESSLAIPIPPKMAIIVAIIDEFADLMMASHSDLETPIARIAQMARAVGIHLVLATQRPSREVITGLIKANFPTRIAFKVSSRINSQIILDETGAESLLGNGDMLFMPPGSSHLVRAQGTFVSDEEIERVIEYITKQAPAQYLIPSFDSMRKDSIDGNEAQGRDSFYEEAKNLVVETATASTTFLQRKLKIGYARAASLMDELEEKGVIGPQDGAKPRRILISPKQHKSD